MSWDVLLLLILNCLKKQTPFFCLQSVQKQIPGQIWPVNHSLQTPGLECQLQDSMNFCNITCIQNSTSHLIAAQEVIVESKS